MAKYDWKQLEREYILGDYKSVSAFLKEKGINNNGTTRKRTSGWKDKKKQKEDKKTTKTINKVIEKESEKEAQKIADLKDIANELALNIIKANQQLETYIVKNKKKTKKVKYDYKVGKPSEEEVIENEEIETTNGIVDRQGVKMLASALKDVNEILVSNRRLELELIRLEMEAAKRDNLDNEDIKDDSFIKALQDTTENAWDDYEE